MNTSPKNHRELINQYIAPYRVQIALAYTFAIVLGASSGLVSLLLGPTLELLTTQSTSDINLKEIVGTNFSHLFLHLKVPATFSRNDFLNLLPRLLLIVASVKAIALFFQWYIWELIGEKIAFHLRKSVIDQFVTVTAEKRVQRHFSDVEEKIGSTISLDIKNFKDFVVHYYGGLPREGFQIAFLTTTLLALSPRLFFIFFICLAPILIVISRLGKKIRRRAAKALQDNSSLTEWIQQRLLGLETIKHFKTEELEIENLRRHSSLLFARQLKAAKTKATTSPAIEFFGIVAMAIAMILALQDIQQQIVTGTIVMSFFAGLGQFGQSASKLGKYFNSNQEGKVAGQRIVDLLQALDHQTTSNPQNLFSEIQEGHSNTLKIDNLSVEYNRDKLAVDNFSFTFEGGKIYCLVGKSGAGKSSIMNFILGLKSPMAGRASLTISRTLKRERQDKYPQAQNHLISYVPQHLGVIPTSIALNVAYPDQTAQMAHVAKSLEAANLYLESARLTKGLDTELGGDNLHLSGGQLQRLFLARLAYHQSPFVLIDEGTSALDPGTEAAVLQMIRELANQGACVIMIAHRLQAAMNSDEVLILKEGRLVESGPAEQIKQSNEFKDVFSS
ncbi:MAG: ABC transporter ATP-binding protein [Proteobacteria bacterium]|nr:ABC transporter ATP-binding protein [Pseudomonadota bacterium]